MKSTFTPWWDSGGADTMGRAVEMVDATYENAAFANLLQPLNS